MQEFTQLLCKSERLARLKGLKGLAYSIAFCKPGVGQMAKVLNIQLLMPQKYQDVPF